MVTEELIQADPFGPDTDSDSVQPDEVSRLLHGPHTLCTTPCCRYHWHWHNLSCVLDHLAHRTSIVYFVTQAMVTEELTQADPFGPDTDSDDSDGDNDGGHLDEVSFHVPSATSAPCAQPSHAEGTRVKRRKADHARVARQRGSEPARTDMANDMVLMEMFLPCGQACIDISASRACPSAKACRKALLQNAFGTDEHKMVAAVTEARMRRLERQTLSHRDHCWPGTSRFTHVIHAKDLLDNGCTINGVSLCVVAAAWYHGHTDHSFKQAVKWQKGGDEWVESEATRALANQTKARGRDKMDDAIAWLKINVPLLACQPPTDVGSMVLNMSVGFDLRALYVSDRIPRCHLLRIWCGYLAAHDHQNRSAADH